MDIDEKDVKHPHCCAYCLYVYHWSADDLAWKYEQSPFMPCGHPWQFRRDMEDDCRIFEVTTSRADDPGSEDVSYYVRSDLKRAYPGLYRIVKSPSFTSLKILDEPTRIEIHALSPTEAQVRRETQKQISQSPFDEPPDDR